MTKYLIEVDDDLWDRFKRIVTRDRTMNEAINHLIAEAVESAEQKTPPERNEGSK